jgi:hypothetical protein
MNLIWNIESSGLSVLSLINIINGPLLAQLLLELAYSNILAFTIFVVDDFNHSTISCIGEVVLFVLELLEPSSIGTPNL